MRSAARNSWTGPQYRHYNYGFRGVGSELGDLFQPEALKRVFGTHRRGYGARGEDAKSPATPAAVRMKAWADHMIDCLLDIKDAVDLARPTTDRLEEKQIQDFEAHYQRILDEGYAQNPLSPQPAGKKKKRGRRRKTKPRNLLERLEEHRAEALAFMYDFNVPFDNNQAERDLRMMKVQQKISGMFRTEDGAKAFCRIRSYISTARKNAVGAMDALIRLFCGNPFVPDFDTS